MSSTVYLLFGDSSNMKVLVINGNPKKRGFIAGVLDIISSYLETQDVEVQYLRLADAQIKDCIGCFQCLKTGTCALNDDMNNIIQTMMKVDGYVVGSPVRNGLTTACYKRFYERITYLLGFPLLLEDKYILAISCVGYMGGKTVNKRMVGLQDIFHTRLTNFIFYKVGMPTKIQPVDIQHQLEHAANKLIYDIRNHRPRKLLDRVLFAVDRTIMRKFIFEKNPEPYTYAINCWKQKGYMKV